MAGWAGIAIVAAATLLGMIVTIVLKQDPGSVLGIVILVGTVIAAFAVRYNAAYSLIPAPALAYVIGAMIPGYIHERSVITGHLELAAHAAEWVGFGFLWMVVGTIVAVILAIGRYVWGRRDARYDIGRDPDPAPAGRSAADARYRDTARADRRPGAAPAFTPSTAYSGGPGTPSASSAPSASSGPSGPSGPGNRPRSAPSASGRAGDPSLGGDSRRGSDSAKAKEPDPYSRYYDEGESWR
jgi:hypothetical protein